MKEIGIKQVFLCMFLCKLEYIKMPSILLLRLRILALSASRFFLLFSHVLRRELSKNIQQCLNKN